MIDPNIHKIINERIKLEIEQQSKYLLEETDRLKAEMAAKGLMQSGAMIKRITKLYEQSIENRAQRIWETLSRFIITSKIEYSEDLATDLKKIVLDYMPDSLPDFKHHIERNVSRFSTKFIPTIMEDLEVARELSLQSVGTEIDLLVHSLKNKIDSVKTDKNKTDEQFKYDVFLSYASKDNQEALKIYEAIEQIGGKAFLSEKTIKPGDDFAEKIRRALQESKELWLLVSPDSVKSEWVISEWGAAWVLDRKIIPILHRCDVNSLPDRLRKLHCIDYYKFDELIKNTFSDS
jgi:hypothetical protein